MNKLINNIDNNINQINELIKTNDIDDIISKILSKLVLHLCYIDKNVFEYQELCKLNKKIILETDIENYNGEQYFADLTNLHHVSIRQFDYTYQSHFLSSILSVITLWCYKEIPNDLLLSDGFFKMKMKVIYSFEYLEESIKNMLDYRSILLTIEITENNKIKKNTSLIDTKLDSLFQNKKEEIIIESKQKILIIIKNIFNKYQPKTKKLNEIIFLDLITKANYLSRLWYQHYLSVKKHYGLQCNNCHLQLLTNKIEKNIVKEEYEVIQIIKQIMI